MAKRVDKVEIVFTGKDTTKKATDSANDNIESVGKTSVVTGAVIAASMAVAAVALNKVVSVTAEFQKLNAMLKVATGSTENAAIAFAEINQFALETPFTVQQVTEAFIKLKNLGLEPSMEALRSYGNTAAAMGKDVMQFVEAIADATVGEFERLKEFGIKARSEGDKVSFTFRGVTTQIGKNAAEIEGFLRDIGTNEFGGAMAEQMDTLGGAMSNAGVALDGLIFALGSELSPTIIEVANAFAVAADSLRSFLNPTINDEIKELTEDLEQLGAQISEQEELGRGDSGLVQALELQSRQVVQKLEELRDKVKTDKLTLADITAGAATGDDGAATAQAVKLKDGLLAFREQQEEEMFILRANRLEKENAAAVEADNEARQFQIEATNWRITQRGMLRDANIKAAEDEAAAEELLNQQRFNSAMSLSNSTMSLMNSMAQFRGKQSRKEFEAQKALNIGLTVANTAAMAVAAGRDTPGPWWVRLAAVLAAVSTGAAQLASIKSATMDGGGSVSGATTSFNPQAAPPGQQPVTQPEQATGTAQAGGPAIAVNTGGFLGKWIEEEFTPAWEEAQSRGVGLVIT